MRKFKMLMILEFPAVDVHVPVAKYDKMVEAFLLYESLDDDNVLSERLEV